MRRSVMAVLSVSPIALRAPFRSLTGKQGWSVTSSATAWEPVWDIVLRMPSPSLKGKQITSMKRLWRLSCTGSTKLNLNLSLSLNLFLLDAHLQGPYNFKFRNLEWTQERN